MTAKRERRRKLASNQLGLLIRQGLTGHSALHDD